MHRFVRALLPAVVAVSATALALAPGATAATLTSSYTVLPISQFRHIVVDQAGGHVFISDGDQSVVVRSLTGAAVTTITNEPGADGLALSPDGATLYVARSVDSKIAAISTSTLSEITTYSTGANTCPASVAALGTNVWFGYGGCGPASGIGVIDLTQQTPTAVTGVVNAVNASILATSPALPGKLFAGTRGGNALYSYDISGATLAVAGSVTVPDGGGNLKDIALTADGTDVITASGAPYYLPEWQTSDLAPVRHFGSSYPYPAAVATASTGQVAAGIYASYDPDVRVYTATAAQLHSFEFANCCGASTSSSYPTLVDAGLAFSADASRLYAVSDDYNGTFRLHVYTNATLPSSALTLSGPSTAPRAAALALSGQVTSEGSGVAGAVLTVKKTDMDGTHTLAGVTADSNGQFTIHDTPAVGGTNSYTVSWAGDDTHLSASKTWRVNVSRATTSLTIKANHGSYGYNAGATLTAHLGTTYKNRTVVIYLQPAGGSRKLLKSAKVDSHGNLTASARVTRKTTFTAGFGGDERYAPRSVSTRVAVHAGVQTAVAGIKSKDGKYRVYSAKNGGGIAVRVSPNKYGENVTFVLQVYRSGAWRRVDSDIEALDGSSIAAVGFFGTTGYHYRIRGQYGGDAVNLAQAGAWQYAEFS